MSSVKPFGILVEAGGAGHLRDHGGTGNRGTPSPLNPTPIEGLVAELHANLGSVWDAYAEPYANLGWLREGG